MNQSIEELEVSFSTADVSSVSICYAERSLTLVVADWRGTKSTVVFSDVAAYKWDESSFEHIDASPDRAYRFRSSEWLSRWPETAGYTHSLIGILGLPPLTSGYLEVIARKMEHKNGA